MSLLPFLDAIERRYVVASGVRLMSTYWYIAIVISAVYLLVVWAGRRWMRDRPKYELQRSLTMWNVALALFSFIGFSRLAPYYFPVLAREGLRRSLCWSEIYSMAQPALWGFLFCISKTLELFDTAFIVLRKSQLTFLHCYHHTTVLTASWLEYPSGDAIGALFAITNYFVHTIMYSYYAVKASGRRLPLWISKSITTLQLCQFFMAFFCNVLAYWASKGDRDCQLHDSTFYIACCIYGSYSVFFVNFFYQRYCKPRSGKRD